MTWQMTYTLQAVVAKAGIFPQSPLAHLKTVALSQGIEMVPLATAVRQHYGIPFCPLTYEAAAELPQALVDLCGQFSRHGMVAYIEAEFFGGVGTQAHAIFNTGVALGPTVVSERAINEALRALGISASGAFDEFEAVGLGQHRDTDEWLSIASKTLEVATDPGHEASIAVVEDTLSLIRRRPEMFVGEAPPRPEFLAAGLAQDALALGVKQAEIHHVGAWWVVASDEDWLTYGNDRSVRETFSHILPFPYFGANACRSEVVVNALASSLFTLKGGRLEILRGDEAAIRDVLTLDLFRRAGNQRIVAFRMTEGAAAMPAAESSRTDEP